jgi:hypothetical protein
VLTVCSRTRLHILSESPTYAVQQTYGSAGARGSSLGSGLTESHRGCHVLYAGTVTAREVGHGPGNRVDYKMAEDGRARLRNVAPPAPEERDAGGTRTALFSGRPSSRR